MPVHLTLPKNTNRVFKTAGHIFEGLETAVLTLTAYISSIWLSFTINRALLTGILLPLYLTKLALSTIPSILRNWTNFLTPAGRTCLSNSTETYRSKCDRLAHAQLRGTYNFPETSIFHVNRDSKGWMPSHPFASDTHEFTVCGATARYIHLRASYSSILQDGRAEHRPIVFLHGNPSWSYMWRHVFPSLLERGHDVYAIDWIGFGRSDKPLKEEEVSLELHVKTLEMFFERTGLTGCIVAGHGWGGCIALFTIPRLPARTVESLFLLNSFFPPRLEDSGIHSRLLTRIWKCMTTLLEGFLPLSAVYRVLAPHLSSDDIGGYTAPYEDLPRSSKSSITQFSHAIPSFPKFILFQARQTTPWKIVEGLLGPHNFNNLNTQARLSAHNDQIRQSWATKIDDSDCEVMVVVGDKDPLVREYNGVLTRTIHPQRMPRWASRGIWVMGAGHLVNEDKPGEVAGLLGRLARGDQGN